MAKNLQKWRIMLNFAPKTYKEDTILLFLFPTDFEFAPQSQFHFMGL